jgi:hypothetical protein
MPPGRPEPIIPAPCMMVVIPAGPEVIEKLAAFARVIGACTDLPSDDDWVA